MILENIFLKIIEFERNNIPRNEKFYSKFQNHWCSFFLLQFIITYKKWIYLCICICLSSHFYIFGYIEWLLCTLYSCIYLCTLLSLQKWSKWLSVSKNVSELIEIILNSSINLPKFYIKMLQFFTISFLSNVTFLFEVHKYVLLYSSFNKLQYSCKTNMLIHLKKYLWPWNLKSNYITKKFGNRILSPLD